MGKGYFSVIAGIKGKSSAMKTLSFFTQKLLIYLFATCTILTFSDCEGKQGAREDAATMDYAAAPPAPAREEAQSKASAQQPEPQFEQKIIKNGNLRFQVADYAKA